MSATSCSDPPNEQRYSCTKESHHNQRHESQQVTKNQTEVEECLDEDEEFHVKFPSNVDVFILSEAGKPIYCYSQREDVITLMGVCIALVNYVLKTQNDQLRSIHTRNGLHINFAHRPPILIVVVCHEHSCFDEQTLINQINAQIVLPMTLKALKSVFQQAPTYDLKRLIHNNEYRTMDILVEAISSPIGEMFTSYRDFASSCQLSSSKVKSGSLFNNVISFYTSTSMSSSSLTSIANSNNSTNNVNAFTAGSGGSALNPSDSNSLVVIQECKPNVLSRVYVPIAIIPSSVRDQITSIVNQSVANNKDIIVSILFTFVGGDDEFSAADREPNSSVSTRSRAGTSSSEDDEFVDAHDGNSESGTGFSDSSSNRAHIHRNKHFNLSDRSSESKHSSSTSKNGKVLKLVSVCNHNNKLKINPLDIQLIHALIRASDHQLSSTESLWFPLCLSRIDPNRFLYGHISYLNSNFCLVLLDLDQGDFQHCQQVKESIQSRLTDMNLISSEPICEIRSNISELGVPHLQYICHQTPRHCIMWQSASQVEFSSLLNSYLIDRMQKLSLKTCWLRSATHQCTLLGWHTATFQLYAQFDYNVSQFCALETVQLFLKWFKKEEDKFIIRD